MITKNASGILRKSAYMIIHVYKNIRIARTIKSPHYSLFTAPHSIPPFTKPIYPKTAPPPRPF